MATMEEQTFVEKPELTMTKEAIRAALTLQKEYPKWQGMSLRLYLEGKGCDGFFYGVTFDTPDTSDLRFPQSSDDDSIELITDKESIEFVNGSNIIWGSHDGQDGFIVENPRHRSFRGKFYKRGFWKKKLEEKKNQA